MRRTPIVVTLASRVGVDAGTPVDGVHQNAWAAGSRDCRFVRVFAGRANSRAGVGARAGGRDRLRER
jgi:hypothetical protein